MRKTFPRYYSSSHSQVCTVSCDRTFERVSEFRIPFTFQSGLPRLVGSCNGILCLTDFIVSEFNGVYLWNPSVRKFKKLPDTCLSRLHHAKLGFGYDSLNNDYKVVRISRSRVKVMPPLEVEVYTLSSDSWKRIGLGIPWRPNVVFWKINCFLLSPFVSGHLHWMILYAEDRGGRERRSNHMILSFDVNSEKFKELPLPADEGSCCVIYLTSFKGKLALIKLRYGVQSRDTLCSIWVMREYGLFDSWNKLCVVPVEGTYNIIGFTKYDLLLIRRRPQLVSTNSELEREVKSVLIDPETLHENEISIPVDNRLDLATHMESLALLDGENVVSY